MKATGIVRRIDDLGRIVLPKEIRRTLRIREGDPLEIFTDREGEIILKKYSPIGELSQYAKEYVEALSQTTGNTVCITDRDQIIAASGQNRKDLLEKPISQQLERVIEERSVILAKDKEKEYCAIAQENEEYQWEVIAPIICEGDAIGSVIMVTRDKQAKFGVTEQKLATCAAVFIGKQLEQ
ncbi:MAG: stage V sporulation protein T [Clostridiales bacterium]|nr:stage V sporulation protein T [Clostridiales bacterium]